MATESIDIRIREDGSRVVIRALNDIGESSRKSASGVDFLKSALGALAGYLAIDKIKNYADSWNQAEGQIRIATKSQAEAAAVTDKLFDAAQRTRQSFGAIVELYGRTARAGKELGVSQQRIIDFTENIGKALAVQHTSSEQAKGALLQLGQALGGGTVRAEEFNSLIEGTPYILQVVSENIKGTEGSISKLRQKMLEGKLTSKEFFEAFERGSKKLGDDFGKSSLTIGNSLTILDNALTRYVGELDKSLGVSEKFGAVIKFIVSNIDLIGAALLALGAAVSVAFAPAIVASFARTLGGLFSLLAANPFTAFFAIIAAGVTYLYQFRDSITVGIDNVTTLGDVVRAVGDSLGEVFADFPGVVSEVFSDIVRFAESAYSAITGGTNQATDSWIESYQGFYSDVGSGFAGVVKGIAKTLDAIGGLLIGLGKGIVNVFTGLPEAISTPFKQMYNVAIDWVEKIINGTIDGINKIRSLIGKDLLSNVTLQRAEVDEEYYKQYGVKVMQSIDEGFETQGGYLLKTVDGIFEKAQQIGEKRRADAFKKPAINLDTPLGPGIAPGPDQKEIEKARKALEKLKNEYRSLLNSIDPVSGAQLEFAKSVDILNRALKAGLIQTQEEHAKLMDRLMIAYRDALDPVGAINRNLEQQTALLRLNTEQREIESNVLNTVSELQQKGVDLSREEIELFRQKYQALQSLTQARQAEEALLSQSVGARKQFDQTTTAAQTLSNDPASGFTKGDAATAVNAMAPDLFKGTQTQLDAQTQAFEDMYNKIDILRQKDLISEQTAQIAKAKIAAEQNKTMLQGADDFFGNMASLTQSSNKKLAAIGKAAAIAQATMRGIVAVQEALASGPPPYNYIQAAAVGVAAAANVAKLAGFQEGGYTGNVGVSDVAGVVHGREFVVNAEGTARNRGVLEAMNAGATLVGGGSNVKVIVNNNADGTKATTQERDTPQGKEIEITIARVVTQNIKRGGSIGDALESQYGLNRSQGVTF